MCVLRGGVAFFDSGIGGLTVLAECQRWLGDGVYYYYGDNHHAPYGNLPPKKIRRYVLRAFRRFRRLKVRAAVLACNTATAICIDELRRKFSFPIVGAEPAVKLAAMKGGRVLVLATCATCSSPRMQALCQKVKESFPSVEILLHPCEGLARAIEAGMGDAERDFTCHLPKVKVDAVVLGCTHYVYIVGQIARFYGCPIYDGNEGIARQLGEILGVKTDKNCTFAEACKKSGNRGVKKPKKMKKLGTVTTFPTTRDPKGTFSNKRSQKVVKNGQKIGGEGGVIFLGKQRRFNQKIHEQMFIWGK